MLSWQGTALFHGACSLDTRLDAVSEHALPAQHMAAFNMHAAFPVCMPTLHTHMCDMVVLAHVHMTVIQPTLVLPLRAQNKLGPIQT